MSFYKLGKIPPPRPNTFASLLIKKNLKMKTLHYVLITLLATFILNPKLMATSLPSITVGGVEAKGIRTDPSNLATICMYELKKINLFDVQSRHDIEFACTEKNIVLNTCLSKQCLTQVGVLVGLDKIMSGSVEMFGNKIYTSFRVLDIKSNVIEKNFSMEFLPVEDQIALMVELTIKKMYDLPYNEFQFKQLTTEQTIENNLNNPQIKKLNLSGPRFGFSMTLGPDGKSIRRPENQGGMAAIPILSQFGYQFEIAYMNKGNIQGLFEVIPNISGIEHGLFIPSVTFLHGVRSNKTGFEFSIGPSLVVTKRSLGYYDENGKWVLAKNDLDNNGNVSKQIDRRGEFGIEGGLLIALGKSFRSGNVNFPVNAYVMLKKDSPRIGISLGFNSKK